MAISVLVFDRYTETPAERQAKEYRLIESVAIKLREQRTEWLNHFLGGHLPDSMLEALRLNTAWAQLGEEDQDYEMELARECVSHYIREEKQ